jgi:hypothetical protein
MRLAYRRLKVYVRLGLVLVVAVAVVTVLAKNRSNMVPVWFFGLTDSTQPINVVWLMLWTAVASLVTWWVFRLTWSLWRDMRELRRIDAAAQAEKDLERRRQEVEQRERRAEGMARRSATEAAGAREPGATDD